MSELIREFDPTRKTVLVLRTCKNDMTSFGGFRWPREGYVAAPDWKSTPECGNGLHGWLWGEGTLSVHYKNSIFLVVEVYADEIVDLCGKVKFPYGWVRYAGSIIKATALIHERKPDAAVVLGAAIFGDNPTTGTMGLSVTEGGTATSGRAGRSVTFYCGKAVTGDNGIAVTRDGDAESGFMGISVTGPQGKATSSYRGKSISGPYGYSQTGRRGVSYTGQYGYAKAGEDGILLIEYRAEDENGRPRTRVAVGYVGENGIKPDTYYHVDDDGKLVESAPYMIRPTLHERNLLVTQHTRGTQDLS